MPQRDPRLAKSRLEALLSMGTSVAAEPLAGIAGLYGAATGGSGEAVRMIDKVRGKLTYQPRDPRGQQEIAGALGPLMRKVEAGKSYLGDKALSATGSPGLAAAAYTAPDALLGALGLRPALAAGRSAQKGLAGLVERSAALPAPSIGSPAAQLGIFAGRNAKTADHGAMQRAASRLAAGDDARKVWREDGWMRGPDGQMRFEIDDSQAPAAPPTKFSDFMEEYGYRSHVPVGEAFKHQDLLAAYPDMSDRVRFTTKPKKDMGGSEATWGPVTKTITMAQGTAAKRARSNVTHELQHSVQEQEGFAQGGMPGRAVTEAAEAQGFNTEVYSPFDLYQRLAGEAEARAVQKRLDYTPQQRRDVYPLDDYDVPLDELIFRGQSDGPQMAIRAYHGSPHDFDKFSMDAIGTGEGAQAYGHGLYFAGNKSVAEGYRKALSTPKATIDGAPVDPYTDTSMAAHYIDKFGGPDEAIGRLNELIAAETSPAIADSMRRWTAEIDGLRGRQVQVDHGGRTYEVELAPDDADLLDWDAPLSEQPEKVRGAWDNFLASEQGKAYAAEMGGSSNLSRSPSGGEFNGESILKNLMGAYESRPDYSRAASEHLRQAGIPGLRYLDGGSRSAGDGSRNYVMFDDSLVKILGKR